MTEKKTHDYKHTISRALFFGGIFLLLFFFIKSISTVLIPFVISFIISYILAPLCIRMQHKLRLSKNFSAGIIVILIQLIFIIILTLGIPAIYNQITSLIKTFPLILQTLEEHVIPLMPETITELYKETSKNIDTNKLLSGLFDQSKSLISHAYSSGVIIVNIFSTIFLLPILNFYILRDWNKIHKTTLNLIPIHFKQEFEVIIHEIRKKVSAYINGEALAIFILSLMYGFGLLLTGLKFGFFIGVLTAVLSIIPYIGFAVCFLAAMLIAFATDMLIGEIIIISLVFLFVQIIESNYVIPKLVGGKIGLHPVWIIFGLLAGGSLLGFIGLLLAIPITTIASVLIKHYIKKYKTSEYYED